MGFGLEIYPGNWRKLVFKMGDYKKGVPEADRVGFWGFVMPDHYMWGPNMGGDSTLDTWIALTYLVANFLACSRIDGYCCYFTVITNKLHLFIYLI